MQITTAIPPSTPIIDPLVMDVFLFIVLIGLFTYFLHRQSRSQKHLDTSSMKPNLTVLIVSLLLIALFGPSNLNIYLELGRIYLIGMSWELGSFMLSFAFFLVGLPFMFMKYPYDDCLVSGTSP